MPAITNSVSLLGHFGSDVEIRKTTGGVVGNVNLATNEKWRDSETGETVTHTEWHKLVFWGGAAETIAKYTGKGSRIAVTGRLRTRKWEKDGITRYTTEIHVDEFHFLSPAPAANKSSEGPVIEE
jgi:single-strand DNA-binding protein